MTRIVVAGHLCLDLTPGLGGTEAIDPGQLHEIGPLTVRLGGSVGNTGGDLAALGLPVDIVASVGDDEVGGLLLGMVRARPLMTPVLRRIHGSDTSYSIVFETPRSDRTFWHHVGTNAEFDGTELDGIPAPDLVHVGYPSLLPALVAAGGAPMQAMLSRARRSGATTSVDLAVVDHDSPEGSLDWEAILRGSMHEVDIITPSVDDLASALPDITGAAGHDEAGVERLAELLVDWGAAVVAVTAGTVGMFVRTAGRERLRYAGRGFADAQAWVDVREWVRPYRVQSVRTTTGAGDAATAGLLYGVVSGLSPRRSASLAMACAAAVVSGRRPTVEVVADIDPDLDLVGVRAGDGPLPTQ
jgi:sugar/nucleoside kinase (ribokinase family)